MDSDEDEDEGDQPQQQWTDQMTESARLRNLIRDKTNQDESKQ